GQAMAQRVLIAQDEDAYAGAQFAKGCIQCSERTGAHYDRMPACIDFRHISQHFAHRTFGRLRLPPKERRNGYTTNQPSVNTVEQARPLPDLKDTRTAFKDKNDQDLREAELLFRFMGHRVLS